MTLQSNNDRLYFSMDRKRQTDRSKRPGDKMSRLSRVIPVLVVCLFFFSTCLAADGISQPDNGFAFFHNYILKLKKAYGRAPDFEAGKGSEAVIKKFVNKVLYGGSDPKTMMTDKAVAEIQKRIGALTNKNLVNHFITPDAESFKFHSLNGIDKTLGINSISRQATIMAKSKLEKVEYTSLIVLEFKLLKTDEGWLIREVDRIKEDLTVTNTSWIYKAYYFILVLSILTTINNFIKNLKGSNLSNKQILMAIKVSGPISISTALILFAIINVPISIFLPLVYMSHLGLFWAISFISGFVAQGIKNEDIPSSIVRRLKKMGVPVSLDLISDALISNQNITYRTSKYANIASSIFLIVPLCFFFSFPEKFTPSQSSVMNIEYKLLSSVKVVDTKTPIFNTASKNGKIFIRGNPGDEFPFLEKINSQEGIFYKVLLSDFGIGYIAESQSKMFEKIKKFDEESDLLNTIIEFTKIPDKYKYPEDMAREMAKHYLTQGIASANSSTLRGHLEAMTFFNEALRYTPNSDEAHLSKIFSMLEINRYLLRDNLFNVFSLFHESAVSYNKIKGLSAISIRYLLTYINDPKNYDERDSLIGLAYLLIDDMKKAETFIKKTNMKSISSKYAHSLITKDPEMALQIIDDLIKLNPDSSLFWHERGKVLLSLKKAETARLAFEQAASLGKENVAALIGELATKLESMQNDQKLAVCTNILSIEKNYNAEAKLYAWLIKNGWYGTSLIRIALGILILYVSFKGIRFFSMVPTLKNYSIAVVLMWLFTLIYRNPFAIEERTMAIFKVFHDLFFKVI